MANNNLPQNFDYGGIPQIPSIPAFKMPDLSKIKPLTIGEKFGKTSVAPAGTAEQYSNFNPEKYDLEKPYQAFPEGKTEMPLDPEYLKTRVLPGDPSGRWTTASPATVAKATPSGGAYAYDPANPNKLIKSDNKRLVSTSYRDKALGGTPMLYQVDHARPLGLGGLDIPQDLQTLDLVTHDRKTRIQAVPMTLYNNGILSAEEAGALADTWDRRSLGNLPKFNEGDDKGYLSVEQAQAALKRWEYEEANNIVEKPKKKTTNAVSNLILNKIPKAIESGSFIPFAGEAPSTPKEIIKGVTTGLVGLPYIPQEGISTAGQVAGYAAYIPAFLFSFGKWIKGASKLLWGTKAIAQGTSFGLTGQKIVTQAIPATVGLADKVADSLGSLGVFQNIIRASNLAKGAAKVDAAAQIGGTVSKIPGTGQIVNAIKSGVGKIDDALALGSSKVISAVNKIPMLPEALKLAPNAYQGLTSMGILKGGATMATANLGASWYSNLYDVADEESIIPVASNFMKDFLSFSLYGFIPKGGNTIFNASRVAEFGAGTMASIILDGEDPGDALLNGAIFAAMGALGSPAAEEQILKSRLGNFYRAVHTPIKDLWRNQLAVETVATSPQAQSGRVIDPLKLVSYMAHEKLNEKLPNNKILEKKIGEKSYNKNYTREEIITLNNEAALKMKQDAVALLKQGKSHEEVSAWLQKERHTYETLFVALTTNGSNVTPEQKRKIIETWIKNKANATAVPTEYIDSTESFNQGPYGAYPKEIATLAETIKEKPAVQRMLLKKTADNSKTLTRPDYSEFYGFTSSGGFGRDSFHQRQFAKGLDLFDVRDRNGGNLLGEKNMAIVLDKSQKTKDEIALANIKREEEGLPLYDPNEDVWKIVSVTENLETGTIDVIPHGNIATENRIAEFNFNVGIKGEEYTLSNKKISEKIKKYVGEMSDGEPLQYIIVEVVDLKYGRFRTKDNNYHLQVKITGEGVRKGEVLHEVMVGKKLETGIKLRQSIKEFNDSFKSPKPGETATPVAEAPVADTSSAIPMPGKIAPAPKAPDSGTSDYMPEFPFKDAPETAKLPFEGTVTPAAEAPLPKVEPAAKAPVPTVKGAISEPALDFSKPIDINQAKKKPVSQFPTMNDMVSAMTPVKGDINVEPVASKKPVAEVEAPLDFSKPIDINKSVAEKKRKKGLTEISDQKEVDNLDKKANPTEETTPVTAEEKMVEDMKAEENPPMEILEEKKEPTQKDVIASLVKKAQNAASALPKGIARTIKKAARRKHRVVSASSILNEGAKNIEPLDYDGFNEGGTLGGITKRIKNKVIELLDGGASKTDPKVKELLSLYDKYHSDGIRGAIKKYDTFEDFKAAFEKNMKEVNIEAFDMHNGKEDKNQVQALKHLYQKVKQSGKPLPSFVFTQNEDGSLNYKGVSEKGEHEVESTLLRNIRENSKFEGIKAYGIKNPEPKMMKEFAKNEETVIGGDASITIAKIEKSMRDKDVFLIANQGGVINNTLGVYIPKETQQKMIEAYNSNKERYAVSDPEMLADMKAAGHPITDDTKIMQVFYTDVAKLGNNVMSAPLEKRISIINNKALRNPKKGVVNVIALPETTMLEVMKNHPEAIPKNIKERPELFGEFLAKTKEDGQEYMTDKTMKSIMNEVGISEENTNLQGTTAETILDKDGNVRSSVLIKGNTAPIEEKEMLEMLRPYGYKTIPENTKIIFTSGIKSGKESFEPYNSPENLSLPKEKQALVRSISNDHHRYMFEKPKKYDPSGSFSLTSLLKIPRNASYNGRPVYPDILKMFSNSTAKWAGAYREIYKDKKPPQEVLEKYYGVKIADLFHGRQGKMAGDGGDIITLNKSIEKFLAAKFQDDVMHLRNLDSGYFKFIADTGVLNGKRLPPGEIMVSRKSFNEQLKLNSKNPYVLLIKNPVTRPLAMTKQRVHIGEDYGKNNLGHHVVVNDHDTIINYEADRDGDAGTATRILTNAEFDAIKDGEPITGIPESIVGWIEDQRIKYGEESKSGGLNVYQGITNKKYPKLPASDRAAMLDVMKKVSEGKQKLGGITNLANLSQLFVDNFGAKEGKDLFTINGKTYQPENGFAFQDRGGALIQMTVDSINSPAFSELPKNKKDVLFDLFKTDDEFTLKELRKRINTSGYTSILKLNKNTYETLFEKGGLFNEIDSFVKTAPKDPNFMHPTQEILAELSGLGSDFPGMSPTYKKSADKYAVRILKEKVDAPDMTPRAKEVIDFHLKRQEEKSDVYYEMGYAQADRKKELKERYEELSDMQPLYDYYTSKEDNFTDEDRKAISWFLATSEEGNIFFNSRQKSNNEIKGFVDRFYDLFVPEHSKVFYDARREFFNDPSAAEKVLQTINPKKGVPAKDQSELIKKILNKVKDTGDKK